LLPIPKRAGALYSRAAIVRIQALILNFFGFEVVTAPSLRLVRHPAAVERLENLRDNSHNFLRISRILQSTAECGLAKYHRPILTALAQEIFGGLLHTAESSLRHHWITFASDEDRAAIEAILPAQVAVSQTFPVDNDMDMDNDMEEDNVRGESDDEGAAMGDEFETAILEFATAGDVADDDFAQFRKAVYQNITAGRELLDEVSAA
jgi:hypothetical protein